MGSEMLRCAQHDKAVAHTNAWTNLFICIIGPYGCLDSFVKESPLVIFTGNESILVGCFQQVDQKVLVDSPGERVAQSLREKRLCVNVLRKR